MQNRNVGTELEQNSNAGTEQKQNRNVRNLDVIYFNGNSTQSLIRTYLTLSLAKTQGSLSSANTQGSVYVRINQRILLNYFIYKQVNETDRASPAGSKYR